MRIWLVTAKDWLFVVKGVIGVALGGWDRLLSALVLFMVVEYLTQILIAVSNRKMSQEIGFCGIAKKVCIFFLVAVGNAIDTLIVQNGSMIRTMVFVQRGH